LSSKTLWVNTTGSCRVCVRAKVRVSITVVVGVESVVVVDLGVRRGSLLLQAPRGISSPCTRIAGLT